MKRMVTILLCAGFIAADDACAQDIGFSRFQEMPLMRNPALAGVFDGDLRVNGIFRNQWASISVPYRTGAASIEYKIPVRSYGDWITLGLQSNVDEAGDLHLRRVSVQPALVYHKVLSDRDNYLSLGFMGGLVSSQFDPTKLQLDDQYRENGFSESNPTSQSFTNTGYKYWDASVGLSYAAPLGEAAHYYVGAALFHFNSPRMSFFTSNSNVTLAPKFALNFGVHMPSGANEWQLLGDVFFQGAYRQVLTGFIYGISLTGVPDDGPRLGLGASYRWNDALIPSIELRTLGLNLGVSYDVNVSQLKTASNSRGGFEFSLSYRASLRPDVAAKQVRCIGF